MGQEKTIENEQLSLAGENRKIKIHREGEEKHSSQTGKRWTVVILVITIVSSLLFYVFSGGGVKIFPKEDGFKQTREVGGEGIFGPKVYEF
jgi:hypothetical protein